MNYPDRKFPITRMRRTRMRSFSRKMISENSLSINDIIWPVFILEGKKIKQEIEFMPSVFRFSIDTLIRELEDCVNLGLNAIALFPTIDPEAKDNEGSVASDPDNLVCRAIRAIKKEFPSLGIICDIALDPYTDHGHDGIVINGIVDNDKTLSRLVDQAIVHAESGCDILAPSDMMDGRVNAIRQSLEKNCFKDIMIMSYAAKYASSFYGPFRDAVRSGKLSEPKDKSTYQMDYANSNEAMHEIAIDISEGADMIMVKPGMPYLDIIAKAKERFNMPTFAYQVSGEYSMIISASNLNYIKKEDAIMETLVSFKRAGADGILTYFAPLLLRRLN